MDSSSPNELTDLTAHRGGDINPPIVVRLMSQRGAHGFEGLASRFPGGSLDQGDVVFTTDDTDSDVVIVQNYLRYDTRVAAREGYIWKWDNEPIVRRPFARGLDRIYTHADAEGDTRVQIAPPVLDWWVNKSFDELASLEPPAKTLMTSAIASTKILIEGHRKRVEFIDRVSQELPSVEIYGEGRARELEDKWDGLAPYRFSIAIENTSKSDYWSEKIADCFLSYTVPLYFGATNISDYFPSDSFIWLPIDSPDEALGIIRELDAEEWERRLPAITDARERVLGRYSFAAQVMGRIRAEREAILASPRTSRVIQGRRTKPGGWIRGTGLVGNVKAQINRRNARRGRGHS